MLSNVKVSLENILSLFNNKLQYKPELEVRFKNINYTLFANVYNKLLKTLNNGKIIQMVNTIMSDSKTSKIHEIYFKNGKKDNESFVSKEQMINSFKVD